VICFGVSRLFGVVAVENVSSWSVVANADTSHETWLAVERDVSLVSCLYSFINNLS